MSPHHPERVGLSDPYGAEEEARLSGPGEMSDLVSEGGGAGGGDDRGAIDRPGGGRQAQGVGLVAGFERQAGGSEPESVRSRVHHDTLERSIPGTIPLAATRARSPRLVGAITIGKGPVIDVESFCAPPSTPA